MSVEFEAKVTWTEGVVGITKLGSAAEIEFSLPKKFGGEVGYVAPEELLLSSLATCMSVVIWRLLHRKNVKIKSYKASAKGWLKRNTEGYNRFTKVVITIHLKVQRKEDVEIAKKAVEVTPKYCPVEAAVEGNIELKIESSVTT